MSLPLLLSTNLKRLKLPTVAKHAESLARDAENSNLSYLDYLNALIEQEVNQREDNQQKERIRRAGFPILKTLESFDFTAVPGLNKNKVLTLSQGEFLDKKENVLCIGNSGTGKSHIASAIALSVCRKGKRVRFTTAATLVNELLAAQDNHELPRLQRTWNRYQLVVLDELGYIPFSRNGAQLLFQFCSERYERASMIITSNLEFSEWTQVFGDDKLTAALLDRLTHHAHILLMNGESYRFKQSMRRQENE
ncbi:MAG: IS21-like element helper ATPase IstB [Bacillota bacterium]